MDWIKKKLEPKAKPQGNVLGTSTPQREAVYAVEFVETTLGFKIGKDEIGKFRAELLVPCSYFIT